ncbi:hypothetical protein SUGI_0654070 [Cryptomeria japonica]|nr:hypothetical protein SUGI_0654070 [Cryptomeria japonica]
MDEMAVVAIVCIAIIFGVILASYGNTACGLRRNLSSPRLVPSPALGLAGEEDSAGLDTEVIKVLPIFEYKSHDSNEPECILPHLQSHWTWDELMEEKNPLLQDQWKSMMQKVKWVKEDQDGCETQGVCNKQKTDGAVPLLSQPTKWWVVEWYCDSKGSPCRRQNMDSKANQIRDNKSTETAGRNNDSRGNEIDLT